MIKLTTKNNTIRNKTIPKIATLRQYVVVEAIYDIINGWPFSCEIYFEMNYDPMILIGYVFNSQVNNKLLEFSVHPVLDSIYVGRNNFQHGKLFKNDCNAALDAIKEVYQNG